MTTAGVKIKDLNGVGGKVPISFDSYQTVKKGQIILCLFDLDCSAVFSGISKYDGMITSAYNVFSTKELLFPQYADYWFQYVFSNRYYKIYSKNIRFSITNETFGLLKTPTPQITEQQKIADFLDKKCAQIDSLISHEEATIAELKSYKQSIITEAVTKGLDKSVPMKDSGVEWLGEIPESWNVGKLKNVCEIFGRIGFRGYRQDDMVGEGDGAITLSPSNMKEMKMKYDKCSYLSWEKYYESPEIQIKNGDILFVKTGSTFGKIALVDNLPLEATINPQIIVMKNFKVLNKFVCYFLSTSFIRAQVDCSVVGGTIPTISQEKILNYDVVIPNYDNQQQIADYLDKKCADIDKLVSIKQQKIEELKEYKKSLIYEYVTGKKEVI